MTALSLSVQARSTELTDLLAAYQAVINDICTLLASPASQGIKVAGTEVRPG